MSDEIEAAKEGAKAVQELAKTGRAVIEAGSELGRYVVKILGTVPEDAVGLAFGDALKVKRRENAEKVLREAFSRVEARGVEHPEEIDLKHIQPLLEAVSEESNEMLQDMWSNLLANAMDPNHPAQMQRMLIDTLKQLEPVDALMLNDLKSTNTRTAFLPFDTLVQDGHIRVSLAAMALRHLSSLECVVLGGQENKPIHKRSVALSPLGEELLLACEPGDPN
jgi:hypothetical protein